MLDTTLLGYNVYRDTTLQTPEPITNPNYQDLNLTNDTYEYCITAVYTYAESEKTCVEASITVGIQQSQEPGFSIYPNPAHDKIFIEFPGAFSVKVFSSTGKQIIQKTDCIHSLKIPVSDLPDGIYYFVINPGEGQKVSKVLVR